MTTRIPERTLNDGTTLPTLGFGTYKLTGSDGVDAIVTAVELGYRLLDTAYNYENEGAVGEAIRRASVPREQLRIASKLPGRYQQYGKAVDAVHESLYRARLEYYDLYLIHWPNPQQGVYPEAWRALVDLRKQGLIRSIGVSNFLPEHIQRIADETGVLPSVNQIELHPYFPQAQQRAFDQQYEICTESWSPLGRANAMLREPLLERIASEHGRSVAQVVLRWHYQLGAVAIPKATAPARQQENMSIFDFELSEDEMDGITGLGRPDGRNKGQDPATYEEF